MTFQRVTCITQGSAIAAVALVTAACVQPPSEVSYGMVEPSPLWSATVRVVGSESEGGDAPGHDMRGEAMMMPAARKNETMVQLGILNASPGSRFAWHVHRGPCGSGGKELGPPSDYPLLLTTPSGTAGVRVTLPFPTPTEGEYHVDVHRSSVPTERVVICGDLQRIP